MSEHTTTFEEAFDPAKEEGTPPITLLPPGKYRAEVIDSSISETKNGKGTLLNVTWSILFGPFEKRLVFQSILTRHESADAQRIGRYMVKDLCVACGITDPVTDIGVFNFKPCTIAVAIERDKEGVYSDKNKVSRITPPGPVDMPPPPVAPATNGAGKRADNSDMNDAIPF